MRHVIICARGNEAVRGLYNGKTRKTNIYQPVLTDGTARENALQMAVYTLEQIKGAGQEAIEDGVKFYNMGIIQNINKSLKDMETYQVPAKKQIEALTSKLKLSATEIESVKKLIVLLAEFGDNVSNISQYSRADIERLETNATGLNKILIGLIQDCWNRLPEAEELEITESDAI
jgi:hypothetical protein